MSYLRNTEDRYGAVTIFLHWVMAILIIGLLGMGLYMTRLPVSIQKVRLYGWHKEFGILVLAFAIVRLIWRLGNITPRLQLPDWQRLAAHSMHWVFYGFMFVAPVSGWLISSAAGFSVSFFDLFILPDFVSSSDSLRLLFTEIHKWLAYGLIAAIGGHSGAALWHHFINKDDILRRILWP